MFESPSAEASLIDRVVISGFRYSRNPALILKPEISDRQSFRALARANDSFACRRCSVRRSLSAGRNTYLDFRQEAASR